MDMTTDVLGNTPLGRAALAKLSPTSPNFRIFEAGWLENGGPPSTWEVMEVKGAEFLPATAEPTQRHLSTMVPGTQRTVHVHVSEYRLTPTPMDSMAKDTVDQHGSSR